MKIAKQIMLDCSVSECLECGGSGLQVSHRKVADTLRSLRIPSGVSLRLIASKLGISAPYLSDLELGRRAWSELKVHNYLNALTAAQKAMVKAREKKKGKP